MVDLSIKCLILLSELNFILLPRKLRESPSFPKLDHLPPFVFSSLFSDYVKRNIGLYNYWDYSFDLRGYSSTES